MQQHALVAACAGGVFQGTQHLTAPAAAAQGALHRHAANAPFTRRMLEQAPRGHGHAQAVAQHHMHGGGVEFIDLDVCGNALLLDEHGMAHPRRIRAQGIPGAAVGMGHGIARLVGRKNGAQSLRHRARGLRGRVGKHVHQLARHQQLLAPENARLQQQGRIAHARTAQANVQQVFQLRRGVVFQRGLLDVDVAPQRHHAGLVGQGQRAPVVHHGGVDVHQVVGVEDDFLHVHLGPAHAQAVKAAEIGALHGVHSKTKPKARRSAAAASAWAWRASGMARPILMNSCVTPR